MIKLTSNKRVVITGIGPLSAIGTGKEQLWQNILTKKSGITLDKSNNVADYYIYKINHFNINSFGIDSFALDEIKTWKEGDDNIDLFHLLAVIKLALDDSGLIVSDRKDVGLVLAHENPGMESFYTKIFKKSYQILSSNPNISQYDYFSELYSYCSQSAYELQTFMLLYHVAKVFNIHGFSLFTNNACSSGLFSLETASQTIKSGKNKVVIVAASDCPEVYRNLWLKNIGLYSKDGVIRPFDQNRNGFVCGQGGASLVLEELEHAKKRKANIYAEYIGGGYNLESWKITIPNITQKHYQSAISEALRVSKIQPKDIDIINAHGVATNIMDQYESNAITSIFGPRNKQPAVTAFKPYIGHNLGGCALLETAILLLALQNNVMLPIWNYSTPDPKIDINVIKEYTPCKLNTVLKICSSFAGFNAAAIFKKFRK